VNGDKPIACFSPFGGSAARIALMNYWAGGFASRRSRRFAVSRKRRPRPDTQATAAVMSKITEQVLIHGKVAR